MADIRDLLALQTDRWSTILLDEHLASLKTCSEPNRRALLDARAAMSRAYEREWFIIAARFGEAAATQARQSLEGTPVRPVHEQPKPEQVGLFA